MKTWVEETPWKNTKSDQEEGRLLCKQAFPSEGQDWERLKPYFKIMVSIYQITETNKVPTLET
jgi:hypothetical protein